MRLQTEIRAVRGLSFLSFAFFLALACGGCGVVPAIRTVQKAVQQQTTTAADESYAQSLTPIQAGPGLVVCEPVSKDAPGEMASFGAGCARWLHLHTGGHGELEQTPLWGQVADSRDLLPRADLRLGNADATRFADLVGVTHLALGTISGNAARATLSYQIYQAHPKLQAIGAPIVASGTREQIVQALPQIARRLAQGVGVKSPRVPAPQIAPADFVLLGSAPWKAQKPVAPEMAAQLAKLAAREPLAGILFLRSGAQRKNKAQLASTIASLMKNARSNTIVVADVARFYVWDIQPHRSILAGQYARYPNNYLLATTEMQWQRQAGQWAAAQSAAEDAVRVAPRSTRAWLDLNDLLADYAQSIRQGKFSTQINAREQRAISRLYPQQLSAAWQATKLTPKNSEAWSEVAIAATFNGNSRLADTALWKAHALDKSNTEVYRWGLQMYLPKWGSDEKKLLQIARLATQHAEPEYFPSNNLVEAIFHGGLKDHREELLSAAMVRAPQDAVINYEMGAFYHYEKANYPTAEKHYRVALASDPNYARATGSLADLYLFVKRNRKEAGRLYQKAVALAPGDPDLRAKLTRFQSKPTP